MSSPLPALPRPPKSGPYEDQAIGQIADFAREWSVNNPGNLTVKFSYIAEGDTEPGLVRGVVVKSLTKQIVLCVQLLPNDPLPKEEWMNFGAGAKKLYSFQLEKAVVREKSPEVNMPDMSSFITAFTESNKQTREQSVAAEAIHQQALKSMQEANSKAMLAVIEG